MTKTMATTFLAAVVALGGLIPLTAHAESQSGTTLTASKTATGSFVRTLTYDWTVDKTVEPTSVGPLGPGETATVTYQIVATRGLASTNDEVSVGGQICVTNGGAEPTENLTLVDQVEYKIGAGQFQPLAGASQTITPGVLAPGESACYDYEIPITPVAGAQYRNSVQVTITNHSGHLGTPFGPEPKADFSLPDTPTIVTVDAEADVTDEAHCPTGFTCAPSDPGPWHLAGSGTIQYTVDITRGSADCGTEYVLENTATLTESDSQQERVDSASVAITTADCSAPLGCTLTIGFWKTHAGFTGHNQDVATPLLPITLGAGGGLSVVVTSAQQAVDILGFKGSNNVFEPANGINKLYAQLLAAKLSIAAGADDSAVAAAIAAADAFLVTHDSTSWGGLSKAAKQSVLGWMTTLDSFNNGLIGPGHCGS